MKVNKSNALNFQEKYFLILLFGFSTALIFIFTSLRYMSFLGLNWDLGINLQMLWTNQHGYLLFETADHMTSGAMTFLQVNSVYIAIPVSYIYNLFPNPFTLFIIQAVILSASIYPLYLYARIKIERKLLAQLVTIGFILNFAVLSGVFYDFHWEAFIPLEFFMFIYFYEKRRYKLSVATLALGALTLQVFPFMAGSYLLYKFVDVILSRKGQDKSISTNNILLPVFFAILAGLFAYAIGLLSGAVIPKILGEPISPSSTAVNSITYLFNFTARSGTIFNSLEYWLLLFAILGFVPFLRMRTIFVFLPWFYWSVLAHPEYTSQFGIQYGILVAALLAPPLIIGIAELSSNLDHDRNYEVWPIVLGPISILFLSLLLKSTSVFVNHSNLIFFTLFFSAVGVLTFIFLLFNPFDIFKRKSKVKRVDNGSLLTVFILLIILVGLVIGPVNPMNKSPPFTGGYAVSFGPSPSYPYMQDIAHIVGHNESVLSTDNLFPFVANNPNAYSFFWFLSNYSKNPNFPYKSGNLPDFLLLDSSQMYTVPNYYKNLALNSGNYGLRLEVTNSNYPGNIYLYQLGYHSFPTIYNSSHLGEV